MKFRKGDQVIVIAGNDKGRTGEVQRVHRDTHRVVVEGINLRWKHRGPRGQAQAHKHSATKTRQGHAVQKPSNPHQTYATRKRCCRVDGAKVTVTE